MCVLRRVCPGWIVRSVLAAIGAAVVAALPLGTSSALAAGPTHISAPTLLKHACSATRAATCVPRHKVTSALVANR